MKCVRFCIAHITNRTNLALRNMAHYKVTILNKGNPTKFKIIFKSAVVSSLWWRKFGRKLKSIGFGQSASPPPPAPPEKTRVRRRAPAPRVTSGRSSHPQLLDQKCETSTVQGANAPQSKGRGSLRCRSPLLQDWLIRWKGGAPATNRTIGIRLKNLNN